MDEPVPLILDSLKRGEGVAGAAWFVPEKVRGDG
jgi:hypothetical protein